MKTRTFPRAALVVLVVGALFVAACADQPSKPKTYSSAPPMKIDPNKKYTATIQTVKGDLVLELFAKDVPVKIRRI